MYEYRATFIRAIDGDTISFLVDLGFSSFRRIRFRLFGGDTYELRGGTVETKELAKKAKEFVASELSAEGTEITIKTEKDKKGSFGRYLATVFYRLPGKDPKDLINELKNKGLTTGKWE